MLKKDKVKELIEHMPEIFSVDDLVEQLILLQEVEKAREQVIKGTFLTEEEFNKELDKWD